MADKTTETDINIILEQLAEDWRDTEGGGCYHYFVQLSHKQATCDSCGLVVDVDLDYLTL